MADIYLYKFNNYYNRIVKVVGDKTPSGMLSAGATLISTTLNASFKWNDGVNNEIVLNYDAENSTSPDYCLVVDTNKNSVWFVLENHRIRNGQFKFLLYRDLINTHYDDIIKAPCFIEKATLPASNPLIFNNENMTFNRVKSSETLIKDTSGVSWIVGYIASNLGGDKSGSVTINTTIDYDINLSSVDFSGWDYYQYTSNPFKYLNDYTIDIRLHPDAHTLINDEYDLLRLNKNTTFEVINEPFSIGIGQANHHLNINGVYRDGLQNVLTPCVNEYNNNSIVNFVNSYFGLNSTSEFETLNSYNGKVIKFSDGYYKINVYNSSNVFGNQFDEHITNNSNLELYMISTLRSALTNRGYNNSVTGHPVYIKGNYLNYYISYEKLNVSESTISWSIPATSNVLNDAPYRMFLIPYFDGKINFYRYNTSYALNQQICDGRYNTKTIMILLADLIKSLGSNLYDIQLLPYCPLPINQVTSTTLGFYAKVNKPNIDFSGVNINTEATPIFNCPIFFCGTSSFSKTINYNINIEDFKISNECDLYKLVSPNYNGEFVFSPAKNGGLDSFNIYCTYKPFSPYIKVSPNFKNLYGKDYNDNRGLICSGDFSLPIVNNAWEQYKIQNKNFQQIFDRQIENMEVKNSVAMQEAMFGAVSGAIQSASSGAIAGALSGGGVAGAVAGGVVSGTAGVIGGAMDIANLKKLQAETIDYTKDQFGYSLGNIKALPNTLTKISSIDISNKIFPFLEYYTCTDEEKNALRDKIKYNGMSVGIIGKIEDYIYSNPTYIKGKIIRLENLDIDYHEANVIAEEIYKGVFI